MVHLRFGRPRNFLPTGILSLEILTNLLAFIVVTCSSYSLLLSIHSLIGWIPHDSLICWLLILSIFCLANYFLSAVISFAFQIYLVFYISAFVSSAYVIIGHLVAIIYVWFYLLASLFVSPDKIIQTASHSCCFLSLGFNFFHQISWTGNVYTQISKLTKVITISK